MRRTELSVGDVVHGFRIVNPDPPHDGGGNRLVEVECPVCHDVVVKNLSNLKSTKSCGCAWSNRVRKPATVKAPEKAIRRKVWPDGFDPSKSRRLPDEVLARLPKPSERPAKPRRTPEPPKPVHAPENGRWRELEHAAAIAFSLDYRYAIDMMEEYHRMAEFKYAQEAWNQV